MTLSLRAAVSRPVQALLEHFSPASAHLPSMIANKSCLARVRPALRLPALVHPQKPCALPKSRKKTLTSTIAASGYSPLSEPVSRRDYRTSARFAFANTLSEPGPPPAAQQRRCTTNATYILTFFEKLNESSETWRRFCGSPLLLRALFQDAASSWTSLARLKS
ncbi:hypothetical protein BGW80DRAFT_1374629, partial [Lactifluus volemus]